MAWWRYGVSGWNYAWEGQNDTLFSHQDHPENPLFEPGRNYAYRVQSCNPLGCSEWSAQLEVSATLPVAPSNFRVTRNTQGAVVTEWVDNAQNELWNQLAWWRWGWSGDWTYIGLGPNQQSYWHEGLPSDTKFSCLVRATNDGGPSAWSPQIDVWTPPAAPSNLHAGWVGSTGVDLLWSDNASTENGFWIAWWKYGVNGWNYIGLTGASPTYYQHLGLDPGAQYAYRVQACSPSGCSDWSNQIDVTTQSGGGAALAANASGTEPGARAVVPGQPARGGPTQLPERRPGPPAGSPSVVLPAVAGAPRALPTGAPPESPGEGPKRGALPEPVSGVRSGVTGVGSQPEQTGTLPTPTPTPTRSLSTRP